MTKSNYTRRNFIAGLGIAGGVSLLAPVADAQRSPSLLKKYILRKRCKDVGAIVRKSFKNLTAAELTAYKNGVTAMKARATNDPTSWTYQAAIHGSSAATLLTAWDTCEHNTTFFMSWHRMYLCFFERILRKASGNPNFGLPYWNYSDAADPNARYLPAAFRTPVAGNPLYDGTRSTSLNAGTGQLSTSAVSLSSVIPGPTGFYPFSGNINSTPHGAVHVSIGGNMGGFNTAGLDPIFWLHHCNIDRLWNRWLAGGGRSNPPATDTAWHNTLFTFFDENANQVQMKGADIVSAANSMCRTCYDEETVFVILDPFPWRFRYRELIIGIYRKPIELDYKNLRFNIDLDEKTAPEAFKRASIKARTPNDELNFRINFEGVKANKPVEFYYEVYLNLPESVVDPNPNMENYAGNVSFFGADTQHKSGHGHGEKEELKFGVNITDAVKRQRNLAQAKTITVTLVPTGLVTRDEKRLPIRSDARISIERITLTLQETDK